MGDSSAATDEDPEIARLASEATAARFAHRLATADQRNGYEVGWYEGHIAALASLTAASG